jgi:CubicO group peptidase (beta-lactamase class C family)
LPREFAIPPQPLETFVDGVVREGMRAHRIAGVTVSIVQDGQVILAKGYGAADLDPARRVQPDRTLFRIGSISKTFTWLLLAQEIERGRIRLDTPINDVLPPALRIPDQGFREPIRLRHLMTHTAGFEDKALGHLFEEDPAEIRPLAEYLAKERPSRVRPPGAKAVYSNYGVGLAGAILVQLNGTPYEVLLERRLLQPLRMSRTTVREPYPAREGLPAPMPTALASDMSDGFTPSAGLFKSQGFEHVIQAGPVGGISTTATDMARYMVAILNGGALEGATVFGPRTAQALRTPLMRTAPGVNGWPYGFIQETMGGGFTAIGHDGATTLFHSKMSLAPELRLGIFVSANTSTAYPLSSQLPGMIVERFYAQPRDLPRPGDPRLKNQAEVYAGSYSNDRRPYSGLEKFVYTLVGGMEVSVSDAGRLVTSSGGATTAWVPAGAPGRFVRADGDQSLGFEIRDGQAVSFTASNGAAVFERAPFHRTAQGLSIFLALGAATAAITLVGAFTRLGRDVRPTPPQRVSNVLMLCAAAALLLGGAALVPWAISALENQSHALYNWPGGVATASWLWLLSALLTVAMLAFLIPAWRGGERRAPGWSAFRKLRHTLGVFALLTFAVVLALNGGLEPWSG